MDPPDFDIGEILGKLSSEDIERISSVAQGFCGGNSDGDNSNCSDGAAAFPFDPEMLFKIAEIFEKLNCSSNDPRCKLISALKPLLSPQRREKADRAIELMKLMSILSLGDIFNSG